MTTAELLATLAREFPNGVSFNPMAVRLLRKTIPLEDNQIADLKTAMFQIGGESWFSNEMILTDKSLVALKKQAKGWLKAYGYFSVERLFNDFRSALSHITTTEACSAFLQHLGFQVTTWKSVAYFCTLPSIVLDDALITISTTIADRIDEAGGTLAFHIIERAMPHLTVNELEQICAYSLPEIHRTEIGGVPCWRSAEAIILPEDFSAQITTIVDTLNILHEKISITKLEFALNLFYKVRFRKEYLLMDKDIFLSICEKHYQGDSSVFPNSNRNHKNTNIEPTLNRRVRNKNTRFCDIGVPIGAQLLFTKDNNKTCTVLDSINKVEYDGTAWSISSLAMYLLKSSPANGFRCFSYEGESLWERRLRIEQGENQCEQQLSEESPPVEAQESKSGLLGLSGKEISTSTWRAFKKDGTSTRVAEWAHRVATGESVEQVALDSGYAEPTMKGMISNYHLYFKVCKLNGIVPEGGTDV